MEGSYKKMRTDIVVGAYSPMGYYNTKTDTNTSYYGNNSGFNNYNSNNYTSNNRGRGRNNRSGNRGGRGNYNNNNNRQYKGSRGSSTFFKPTMLLDPWQDLVENMIMTNQLPER